MPVQLPGVTASATIQPSRFVRYSGVNTVAHAAATDVPIGVSQRGTGTTPLPGAATSAATASNVISIFGNGEMCPIEAGEVIAAGDFLRPGTDGVAMKCVGGEPYYAIAREAAGAIGIQIDVLLIRGVTPVPNLTVAAAGTNAATGTLLQANSSYEVTGASGTNAVTLPNAPVGTTVTVYSSAASNALLVFPPTGCSINNGTTDAALSQTARTTRTYRRLSSTLWSA